MWHCFYHHEIFFMDWQSIILIFWVIILIQYLCYRKSSPRFCYALEVLHQVVFFPLHTKVSSWYTSKPWGFTSYTLCSIILENSLCIHLMSIPTHEYCGWYNGLCRGVFGLLEQAIIIVFSLHLGEPLVLDLAMLTFISLSYTILHHNFQYLCLTAFSEFISGW